MMRSKAGSIKAKAAYTLVEELQLYFVRQLNVFAGSQPDNSSFKKVEWFRDAGVHGGGTRYESVNESMFNRASVNVSQVHYDDNSSKNLGSATAISTIIHPQNPHAPSVHMHISWTEMKNGKGYWRMMADLNPAIENPEAKSLFETSLNNVAPLVYELAARQGDKYFYIPALQRHRGVSHFYLEEYNSDDEQADYKLAKSIGETVINCYLDILSQAVQNHPAPTPEDYKKQLQYHTLYLFQVLTLDRGTTSGLLVHDQNDLGIMGSLPAQIDKVLLAIWKDKLPSPQDELLIAILKEIPDKAPCIIDQKIKLALAQVVRQHYNSNPKALSLQAQGNITPPTVNNHQ